MMAITTSSSTRVNAERPEATPRGAFAINMSTTLRFSTDRGAGTNSAVHCSMARHDERTTVSGQPLCFRLAISVSTLVGARGMK